MNFDGTDWLVLLTIILVIVAILTFLTTVWPKWKRRRSEPEATLIYQLPSDSGKNFDTIPDPRRYPISEFDSHAFGGRGFRSGWDSENLTPAPPPKNESPRAETEAKSVSILARPKVDESAPAPDRQTSASPRPKRRKSKARPPPPASARWQDLMDETITVPAGYGQHWATRLDLDEGDEIRGTLTEVDDDDFSYMVLDEANYAAFRGGDDYEVVDEAEETPSVRVDFSVDVADRYYLVLYAYGKQNDREVEVSLRVRTGSS